MNDPIRDMDLGLGRLLPSYLSEEVRSASEVWGEDLLWKEGQRIGITGPSGQGKSTLIRILCGLEQGYRGRLNYGREIMPRGKVRSWPLIRSRVISVLLQDFYLVTEWSGTENLRLVPVWSEDVTERTLRDWTERLEIDTLMGRPVETWSKGQAQRLALLRVLISPAAWLLLDEPFSHLDAARTAAASALIEEVVSSRGSGWILTHLEADPEMACDRVMRI